MTLTIKDTAGQTETKSFSVTVEAAPVDNPPYFDAASLPSSVTIPGQINFTGTARDDKGLSEISMKVVGEAVTHTVFTENISGTSKSLGSYYFNSGDTTYANKAGLYTVTLTIRDSAGQIESKSFLSP